MSVNFNAKKYFTIKVACAILLFMGFSTKVKADHITGGEFYYTYLGNTSGTISYSVTFKVFMRCNSGRSFNNPAIISIFDRGTNQRITNQNVILSDVETIMIEDTDPCISNPPQVCYTVGYYNFTVSLPASA